MTLLVAFRHRAHLVRLSLLAAAALAVAARPARAQPTTRATLKATLDSIITAEMAARKWPSLAVMLVKGRDTILHTAYGKADIELDVPARADGIYWIGSVTKQFVAAEILLLAERGALSLDDSVGRWVEGLPVAWRGTGLRELLWHTSGIPSYTGAPRARVELIRAYNPVDSTLALVRDLPPDFPRGSNMLYDNTGYILLGKVIEAASKKTLAAALKDDLWTPQGLTSLSYCTTTGLVPNRVTGYARTAAGVERAVLWWPDMAAGAGALCGTVADLVHWSEALHGGKVLSPASYRTMTTPGHLADGTPLRYAMGLLTTEVAGHRAIQHTGGIAGFTTWLAWLPDDSIHVAMTVSLMAGGERPSLAGVKVIARLVGDRTDRTALATTPALRKALAGAYGTTVPYMVTVREDSTGALVLQQGAAATPLAYKGAAGLVERFTLGDGTLVHFDRPRKDAPPTRVRVDGGSSYLVMPRQP